MKELRRRENLHPLPPEDDAEVVLTPATSQDRIGKARVEILLSWL